MGLNISITNKNKPNSTKTIKEINNLMENFYIRLIYKRTTFKEIEKSVGSS